MPIRSNNNLQSYYDRFGGSGAGGPEYVGGIGNNYGARAIVAGGYDPSDLDTMDYRNISTTGNFTDFGDLQVARRAIGCCSNSTRMCTGGGYNPSGHEGSSYQDLIGYITTSTTGNAQDFGNLTFKRYALSALSNGTRGVWCDGQGGDGYSNIMDYVTIATTGNAADLGDTTFAGRAIFCAANNGRGLIGGGWDGGGTDRIEYMNPATLGNARDFGNMLSTLYGYNAASTGVNMTRAVYTGGRAPSQTNVMGYMTIDTTGNATDFGDMHSARDGHGCCTNDTRMLSTGGTTTSSYVVDVEYITVANTGNGTDFGDLTVGRWYTAASSGSA